MVDRRLKKINKTAEAYKWLLESFQPLQFEAASTYDNICPTRGISVYDNFKAFKKFLKAVADDSPRESALLAESVERLPATVERIKALPKSDMKELRMAQEFEVKALNAFIEACKLGIAWATVRKHSRLLKSGQRDRNITMKLGHSRHWVKRARKEAARNGKPLEAAMFSRFTQAYKLWKKEMKVENVFREIAMRTAWGH